MLTAWALNPPATSTLPLGSNVAVAAARGEVIVPVSVHDPLAAAETGVTVASMATIKPSTPTITATARPPLQERAMPRITIIGVIPQSVRPWPRNPESTGGPPAASGSAVK